MIASSVFDAAFANPSAQLADHLKYFEDSVAGNLSSKDFDDIFDNCFNRDAVISSPPKMEAQPVAFSSPLMPLLMKAHVVVPSSPTSSIIPGMCLSERQQHSSSPTSVVSSSAFVVRDHMNLTAMPLNPLAPKPLNSKKRTYEDLGIKLEDKRRERNRLHAQRSRQRKRNATHELEEVVKSLKEENERLAAVLGIQDKAEEQRRFEAEQFVDALKKPKNRVLNDHDLGALQEFIDAHKD